MVIGCLRLSDVSVVCRVVNRHIPPLHFPTAQIERVNLVKLLGINLNSDFSWKSHVEAITSIATQRIYFLKQLRRAGVPQSNLLQFGITCSPNHKLTKLKPSKEELLGSSTATLMICLILMHYTVPALNVDRREQLSRKFFLHQSYNPRLHTLLPTPRDLIITTRLRSANKFPRLPSRTRKYHTFISYALAHYQTS